MYLLKAVVLFSTPGVVANEKGASGSLSTMVANFTVLTIYVNERIGTKTFPLKSKNCLNAGQCSRLCVCQVFKKKSSYTIGTIR